MTSLAVENIAKEKTDIKDQMLGVNIIEVTIDGKTFEFPDVAVIKSELDKVEQMNTNLNTSLIQMYYQIQHSRPITNEQTKKTATNMYNTLKEKYPNSIIDFGFEFLKSHKIRDVERRAILEIQKNVNSVFLTDVETDKDQSVENFAAQLENIENPNNQIICPSIDLDTVTPGVFSAKLDYILEKEYPRFNVKFASFDTRYANWLDLSEKIFEKDVWCNLTSVTKGYFHLVPPQRSLLACSFLYGVHTASHNYRRFNTKKDDKKPAKKPKEILGRVLDRDSLCFNKDQISPAEGVVKSMKNLEAEIQKIKEHVKNEKFYTEYAPKRKALSDELSDLERRM